MRTARSVWPLLLVSAGVLCANCSPTNNAADVTNTTDSAVDTAIPDVSMDAGIDVRPDVVTDAREAAVDASDVSTDAQPTAAECAPSTAIDLNAMGTTTDVVTRFTTSTASTIATGGLAAPSCQTSVGHPLVFRYTARAAASLRISTNNAGTTFDTVAWALDRCSAAVGTMELGCGDDDNEGTHENASTFVTSSRVAAGQTIYIVVAGMGDASGAVEISVSELRDVAVGGACDPSGATTLCTPEPASCVTASGASHCEMPMYIESGIATPTFIDACATGAHATLVATGGADARDDGHATAAIALPFAFRFFGNVVTTITPSSNGYAVFDGTPIDSNGGDLSIPMPEEGSVIAPFWQNLVLRAAPASDVCTQVTGSAPNRQFVIEWHDAMPQGNPTSHVTFEAVLSESSNNIDFVYQQLEAGASPPEESDGSWSAIGVQSNHGERTLVHNGSVDTANGLRFAPL